jgi:glycosyltransferase involved in cell wall biosynthesis
MSRDHTPLRVLLEMRPTLEGHTGLAQVCRLLFRGLSQLPGVQVEGLLQSAELLLAPGLPTSAAAERMRTNERFDRLGGVVVALEAEPARIPWRTATRTIGMAFRHLFGGSERLTRFDASHYQDFLWRKFFAQTLPAADYDLVTHGAFRIARIPWNAMHICALVTRKMGHAMFPRLDTADFDVMIVETPYPGSVSKRTQLVVHYHDALPMLMPHTISKQRFHQAFHYRALRKNVASDAWFVCVSDATRNDLLSIFPQLSNRSVTIHNVVSHDYFDEPSQPQRVPQIVAARLNTKVEPPLGRKFQRELFAGRTAHAAPFDFLFMVSKMEPRKNHLALLSAWEKLRSEGFPALKLVVVGPLGQRHQGVIRRFYPWLERGEAFVLEDLTPAELRVLYKHARATVCPSLGEGFDFSGVEAMKSGGAVVASSIAAHTEIYADAAEFFNPYSVQDLVRAVRSVIEPANATRRAELVARGGEVAKRYDSELIMPRWQAFLESLARPR